MVKIFLFLCVSLLSLNTYSSCEAEIRSYLSVELEQENTAIHDLDDNIDNFIYLGDGMFKVLFYIARTDLAQAPLQLTEWEIAVAVGCHVVYVSEISNN